jgi:sulfatase modifying factor 1
MLSFLIARMSRVLAACGVAAMVVSCAMSAHAVTIDWVTVGDPGNAADAATNYGVVADAFQIGKYEVTIQQYTDFLNAVAASDPYSLYNTAMASDLNIAGISRTGTSGGYTYSVITNGGNSANRPITYVSWFDAARFANWMQNGQGSGSTETGAYTLGGATTGAAPAVNPGAQVYIPREDQWYKAAYYKGGGTNAGYWAYATQSDADPGNAIGSGTNQANYYTGSGFSVSQSATYSSSQNYLTDVGAFTNSASFYGTFDQSGNAWELNDLTGTEASRGVRGGYWETSDVISLSSLEGQVVTSSYEDRFIGFRLASPVAVPEPSTYAMALAGLACGGSALFLRRRAL